MKIELISHSSNIVIAITGEIDMHSSPELRARLLELIGKKPPVLFIDFTSVSYIDSSGIATFVEGLKGMMPYGGRLKFVSIPPKIAEIFGFAKLDKVFEIHGSMDDALRL
ncbi:MAG: STAS domain-containing protein [Thermodesulfovibrionales bacterium]